MKTDSPSLLRHPHQEISTPARLPAKGRQVLPWLLSLVLLFLIFRIAAFVRQPPVAEVATVKQETVVRVLALNARVRPRYTNRITPVVSGRLVRLNREEGEAVQQGEVLAQIFDEAATAALRQAQAAAATEQERWLQACRDFERARELHQAGLISAEELEKAQLTRAQFEKTLQQRQAVVAEARARLADYLLRAPFNGYVLARPVDPGQIVTPGTVIYEIATTEQLEVEAEVDEQYLSELTPGMPATVSPLGNNRRLYETRLCYIAKGVNPQTGAAIVRFCFVDAPPAWPIGLSLDVNLTVARHENALTVPRAAVAGFGSAPYVYVVREGRATRRPVQVIDWQAERIVVLSGLAAGETVIMNPRMVSDGMAIRPRLSQTAL
ncbi:MAG: efflux RND transporter periplasmic adaptor subunit [candidate division KSB1 bacterium]|nr:efflux RND transporter periplasmic adaptor subunit [candidate division KSB1 bacterium]MDZ7275167.1 efflux RND transporter periplasmic adaptor subunit [candidate division KSB1 bacterium]MDZ7287336.1 efflux RND transporter periplasmic adaptor subunit [candidate division KSB1 bacterium]MDZ7299450.1 efflux RND transporter periplasmic adaptor subunit [candidate division KSB1 bacterium]MDZ7305504.1 efflux RND transporter periplasmic adaptor subunit [candidate division KSB1 bacterium]